MTDNVYKAAEGRYETDMQYNRCAKSGVILPAISLGMWQNFGDTVSLEHSREILRKAFDSGICHIDLANNYGPKYGAAESTFGEIMKSDFRPYRDELFISTKAGWDMWPGPYGDHGSRKYLMASLDQSLKRMNLDYVDIFYSHRYDPQTPLEETMQALVDIVRSGKALYAGISQYPTDVARQAMEYLEAHDVHCLLHQVKYNMLERGPETTGQLQQAKENGTGFIAFSALAQGLLTNRYFNGIPADSRAARNATLKSDAPTPELIAKLRELDKIAARRGQTLAQMALAWVLKDDLVCSVIVGASSVQQLENNIKAAENTHFDAEELAQIDAILSR